MIDPNSIKNSFKNEWKIIKEESRKKEQASWKVLDRITNLVDETVMTLVQKHSWYSGGLAVLALGGYARRQMAPYSDIDLLILHDGELCEKQKEFFSLFTTDLWDLGTNPGIQIKEINEVVDAAMEDDVVRTSFIDNRFLIGDTAVYNLFTTLMNERIAEKGVTEFLMMKIQSVRNRSNKFRDSIFRLEPNIKEGSGGIRDINTICWICNILYKTNNLTQLIQNGMLTASEYDRLMKESEFLFRVRNEVHYYHNRKYDVMTLDTQKEVAEVLGYRSTSTVMSVENFMRDYYRTAKTIAEITEKVINRTMAEITKKLLHHKTVKISDIGEGFVKYGNQLSLKNKTLFAEKPKRLLTVFMYAATKGLKISDNTYDTIRENLYLIDGKYIKQHGELFLKILSRFPNAGEICSRMAKAGILSGMIPEFEGIVCKPQFDYYHHYTVDEHTFIALGYIDKLITSNPPHLAIYQEVYTQLKRKDLLALAIFLHDIGKGQGKNHSQVGARMSRIICQRLGMNNDDTDTISTLVLHHLLMSHIAQRRDIHDVTVISHFLNFINSEEELKLLFLLTYADMNAVGGKVFNEWRNTLLTELYTKSLYSLDKENLEEEQEKVIARKREKLLERTAETPELAELAASIDDELLYTSSVGHILRQLHQALRVKNSRDVVIETELRKDLNGIEINVCTQDYAGVLKCMAGALSSLGLNILWAQINTLSNKITIDRLIVQNPWDENDSFEEKCDNMIKRVREAVLGNFDINKALESKQAVFGKKSNVAVFRKDKIVFDNELSANCTILDIYTEDRLGLLYNVLGIFKKLGLNLIKAKISTDVDRVVDSFYLTDLKGEKITDEQKLKSIREELIFELGSPNL